jgi:acetyl esterase/lipase
MAIDPEIAESLQRVKDGGWLPLTGGSVAEARTQYRDLSRVRRGEGYLPEQVSAVGDTTFPGPGGPLSARVYVPADPIDVVVVFLHGGGWVIGDLDTHDPICRALANATQATVAAIDYRLAPETPYPGPLDDAMAALAWAAAKWPEHRLAIAGDSAGGGLAAGCALRARDTPEARDAPDVPPLVAQLLVYPALDPTLSSPSVTENADGYFLTRADMIWFWGHYLPGGASSGDAYVAPGSAGTLDGLPPAVVAVAEFDPLRDEGTRYAQALTDAGVAVTFIPGDGLVHGWLGMTELSPVADRAAAQTRAAFAALLG